jgi:hypothetical protein
MAKDSIQFSHDGKEYFVRKPTVKDNNKAQEEANKAFKSAVHSGALLRSELDDELKKRKLWSDEKEAEFLELKKALDDAINVLRRGGKLDDGRKAALKVREIRAKQRALLMPRYSLDSMTAEGQSENAKLNCLVALCSFSADKSPIFKDYEDYINRSNEDLAVMAATKVAELVYNYDESYDHSLPENKFLTKYNLVDAKLRLVNKAGHLVDEDGRLINEEGRFIKYTEENGVRVPVLVDGKPVMVDRDNKEVEDEVQFGVFTDE